MCFPVNECQIIVEVFYNWPYTLKWIRFVPTLQNPYKSWDIELIMGFTINNELDFVGLKQTRICAPKSVV